MPDKPPSKREPVDKRKARTPVLYGVMLLGLVGYAIYGLSQDDMAFPYVVRDLSGNNMRSHWLHFHGPYAWFLAACALLCALGFGFGLVNYYTERGNLRGRYATLASVTALVSFVAAGTLASLAHFFGIGQ